LVTFQAAFRLAERYRPDMESVRAVLIDIDGVLTVSWRPLPGAVEALREIRDAGLGVALVTNTTSRTRASIAATLDDAGFPVAAGDILTAPAVTAAYLAEHWPGARCALLNSGDIRADLGDVTVVDPADTDAAVDVVVVGGAGPEFGYAALDGAFRHLQQGARLVAMHRNPYWRTEDGLRLDAGAFLVGLEQAARVEAEVTGKPSAAFFAAALAHLGAGRQGGGHGRGRHRVRRPGGAARRDHRGAREDRQVPAGDP
jgi:HAD superfamily hydrolase (TIGR01450 family)